LRRRCAQHGEDPDNCRKPLSHIRIIEKRACLFPTVRRTDTPRHRRATLPCAKCKPPSLGRLITTAGPVGRTGSHLEKRTSSDRRFTRMQVQEATRRGRLRYRTKQNRRIGTAGG
jgi:hypothetical protein